MNMADYCDADSVQKLLKWFEFSETSKITTTELEEEFIPESTALINSKLERIYVTPITNSDDVEILQYIACRMVACEIANVLILQADGEISDIVSRWCREAKEKLQEILDRKVLLPNSTLLDSGNRLYSFTAHGSDFLGESAPSSPVWRLEKEQW
jgi:hypothetical protein